MALLVFEKQVEIYPSVLFAELLRLVFFFKLLDFCVCVFYMGFKLKEQQQNSEKREKKLTHNFPI